MEHHHDKSNLLILVILASWIGLVAGYEPLGPVYCIIFRTSK